MTRPAAAVRLLLTLVLFVLFVLSAVACAPAAQVRVTDTVTTSIEAGLLQPGMLVRIEMFNGDVAIEPSIDGRVSATVTRRTTGASDAEARATLQEIRVTSGITTGEAFVRAVYGPKPASPDRNAASAVVSVPPDSALIVHTSNGAVRIAGIAGPLNIRTSNAAVTVTGGSQGVSVSTTNGAITTTGGGGLMSLQTSNGTVDVRGAQAARLRIEASNGAVTVDGSLGEGASLVRTSNAPVRFTLPAAASFDYGAETSNADVAVSGFDGAPPRSGRAALSGSIGATPTARLTVTASNGAITITGRP